MEEQLCKNCMFSFAENNNAFCRRMPPQLLVVPAMVQTMGLSVNFRSQFPIIIPDKMWCGEFKVKVND